MKAALLATGVLLLVIAASGCTGSPGSCPAPYANISGKCCLDGNNNSICDFEEQTNPTVPTTPHGNYAPYEVKMYISHFSPEPDGWSKLPTSPVRNFDGYQIYNYPNDTRYYDGGWFMLYSPYVEEPITCTVTELHDSNFYNEFPMQLTRKGTDASMNGAIIRALYQTDSVLQEVKYTISCSGDQSGIKFQDTYAIGIRKP